MRKYFFLSFVAVAMISAAIWFTACQKEDSNNTDSATEATDRTNGNSKVFPFNANPYGKSYTDWTVDWWLKFMTFDCANNPFFNSANVLFYQEGPVYFLAGLNTANASVSLTIPHGKAILFPLFNVINDYPCPPEFNFEPPAGQTLEAFLKEGALGYANGVTNMSVAVDGATVTDPASYKFTTDLFYFTGNSDLSNCLDPCVTGESQATVCSGYYMMLKPLSKGEHSIHYHMEYPAWGWIQEGTYNITIE